MKQFIYSLILFFIWILSTPITHAQVNVDAYYKYLKEHSTINVNDLLQEYPAGVFAPYAPVNLDNADHFKSIDSKFKLTEFEKSLAAKNSFMVTERLSYPSYAAAYADAYIKDLPVYISSDAMLHVLHRLYDGAIADLEKGYMRYRLFSSLHLMKVALRAYPLPNDSLARKARNDVDIYLTVAQKLMENSLDFDTLKINSVNVLYPEDSADVKNILRLISKEQLTQYSLFGTFPRDIDFSQMTPRSHYTGYELSGYFQAMVWLGRTEIYLTKPESMNQPVPDDDIKRQCMMAVILANLAETSGANKYLSEMDSIVEKLVGEQDNLSLPKLYTVMSAVGISSPDQLRSDSLQKKFQDEALKQGAGQKILSQLHYGDPGSLNTIKPAAAFMLMGQRFLFDAFILGNVVFDKVKDRLMPSTLDAMYVLGNNSAVQLLIPEIEKYGYAKNLAGLRYLANSFSKEYWNSSMYSTWLSGIRSLNPPANRASLPRFMQTNAWWQKTLNTQLGSWTELRHDNTLYGKSSYTGGVGCFYPACYVEPNSELYNSISMFAKDLDSVFSHVRFDSILQYSFKDIVNRYILNEYAIEKCVSVIIPTCSLLGSMSEKELKGESFNFQEQELIANWPAHPPKGICTGEKLIDGTYIEMLYKSTSGDMTSPRYVVADVHTQPTDLDGNIVGNVLHIGTGYVNTALIIAEDPSDGCKTAYVGPVGSYYEYTTSNFKRLADDEWGGKFSKLPRPAWVNSYLASDSGRTKGEEQNLFLGGISEQANFPASHIHAVSSPNPTNASTVITFDVPPQFTASNPNVSIYSVNGTFITTINCTTQNSSTYTGQWNGLTSFGEKVPNGVYLIHITMGKLSSVFECIVNR